jgi:hypothetical protein
VRKLLCLAMIGLTACIVGSAGASAPTAGTLRTGNGKALGIVTARASHSASTSRGAGNLKYHGGPVEHTNTTYAIYWVPSGYSTQIIFT